MYLILTLTVPQIVKYQRKCMLIPKNSLHYSFDSFQEVNSWYEDYTSKKVLKPIYFINVARESLTNYLSNRPGYVRQLNPRVSGSRPIVTVFYEFKEGSSGIEDGFVFGDYSHPSGQHYWLRWPEVVDEFIYFSKHFITIPSVGWVNYLHRFGIPVMGTLNLDELGGIYSDNTLLQRDSSGQFLLVTILTTLCQVFNFEGWLVHLESTFTSRSNSIVNLVRALRSHVRLHVKCGRVIWYESYVARSGKSEQHSGVNLQNWQFLDAADRLITNCFWKVANLTETTQNIGTLYMQNKVSWGLDSWGRGAKLCGSGLACDIAINAVKKASSNITLFAPAWTYENFQYNDFPDIDDEFWAKISKSVKSSDDDSKEFEAVPWYINSDSVSFLTLFSTGSGSFFNFNGTIVSSDNWVHLSLATPMPNKNDLIRLNTSDAFIGGNCISIIIPKFQSEGINIFKFDQYFKAGVVDKYQLKARVCYKGVINGILPCLVIRCYVIRRGKMAGHLIRVKDLSIRILLNPIENWEYREAAIDIPTMSVAYNEEILVESCELEWTIASFDGTDLGNDPWLIVPNEVEMNQNIAKLPLAANSSISLGLFSIEIAEKGTKSVKNRSRSQLEDSNTILKWQNYEDAFMWIVMDAGFFKGVTFVNCWPTLSTKNIQIYKVQRNGEIMEMRV
ncbi:HBL378Wp [Eremothecium sinecaudum]|uniref:HBL378Wp n=1 Tax=Eremothecium sinecaudum TaxID=45286 RepID=A0A120K0N4_9SACH|nr:HBL378Wp [Eremothecium sinecaudum]AMD18524.1 HBL378Wp [Eremothecium sinecaudum]